MILRRKEIGYFYKLSEIKNSEPTPLTFLFGLALGLTLTFFSVLENLKPSFPFHSIQQLIFPALLLVFLETFRTYLRKLCAGFNLPTCGCSGIEGPQFL